MMACVLTAGAAWAHGTEGERPRRSPDALMKALQLTGEQVSALQELRRSRREAMRPIGGEMRELGRQLREEMSKESPSASAAGQFLVDMKAKRDEIEALAQQFRDRALGLLDEGQRAALSELESGREMAPAIRQAMGLGLLAAAGRGLLDHAGPGFAKRGLGRRGFGRRRSPAGPRGRPGGGEPPRSEAPPAP